MDIPLDKVTAFVTRQGQGGIELLLFEHPNAGIQIPAGTVAEGEKPEAAALREVCEETGLTDLRIEAYIGCQTTELPEDTFIVLKKTKVFARPDITSFDWAELRRGIQVSLDRQQGEFAQITYQEGDRYPDPQYITYQITGWVPNAALSRTIQRHFYHLSYQGKATPDAWQVYADQHHFRPFWAPLLVQPEIIAPQRAWLEFVIKQLGYTF